jgi:hypothetical protein
MFCGTRTHLLCIARRATPTQIIEGSATIIGVTVRFSPPTPPRQPPLEYLSTFEDATLKGPN